MAGWDGRIGWAEASCVENDELTRACGTNGKAAERAVGTEEIGGRNIGAAVIGRGGEESIVLGIEAKHRWIDDAGSAGYDCASEVAVLDDHGDGAIGQIVGSEGIHLAGAGEDYKGFAIVN